MAIIGTPNVGLTGTDVFGTDDLIRDVDRLVRVHDRESAPLLTYLTHTAGRMVSSINEDFFWQEVQYDYTTFSVAAGLTGGGATEASVLINSPEVVPLDCFSQSDTGQYFIVNAVTAQDATTTTVTIQGIGGNIQAVAGPCIISPCGIALGDGAFYPEARGIKPVQLTNTVTIRAASVEVSHGADRATLYGGQQRQTNNEFMIANYRAAMERDILFSQYAVLTGYTTNNYNGSRVSTIRFTRGILNVPQSNIDTYSGDLTEDTWDDFLGGSVWPTRYSGSQMKLAFMGPLASQSLHKSLKQRVRILSGPGTRDDRYGLRIVQYETHAGQTLQMFVERNFFNLSPWEKGAMVLDPKFIMLRHHGSNMMEIYDTSL